MLSEHQIIEWVGFWLLGEMRQQWWNYGSHCDGWVKKPTRIVHNLISEDLDLLSKPNQSLVQGGRCRTECRQTDQSYFWCFDRWNDLESWDYCSPPGQVGDCRKKFLNPSVWILDFFNAGTWCGVHEAWPGLYWEVWKGKWSVLLVVPQVPQVINIWWFCLDKMATMLVLSFKM